MGNENDQEGLHHCTNKITNGYLDIVQLSNENNLSLHFMTYPFPKNKLPQEKWNNFMWMSFVINKQIRNLSKKHNIPLIDAESCMEDLDLSHWNTDYFHLQRSGSQKHIACIFNNHLGIRP